MSSRELSSGSLVNPKSLPACLQSGSCRNSALDFFGDNIQAMALALPEDPGEDLFLFNSFLLTVLPSQVTRNTAVKYELSHF